MAKILISLLGTGRLANNDENKNEYLGTDYQIGEKENKKIYKNEKFVANAIIKHYGIEKLFLVGTNKSMWDNINEVYGGDDDYSFELLSKKGKEDFSEKDLRTLNKLIDSSIGNSGSHCYIVNDGKNTEELWSIFDKLYDILEYVEDGDEVYFDLTHLFRSLSIMSFIAAEFGKTYKNFTISGVFYGMLNADGPSPVVDMSVFFEMLEWAKAIRYLKRYGNPSAMAELVPRMNSKETTNAFYNFSNALLVSDIDALMKAIKVLKGKIKLFGDMNNKMAAVIFRELDLFIKRFEGKLDNLSSFQYEFAKFYAETDNYPMSYLTLTEAIISKVCEMNHLDPSSEDDRYQAKGIMKEYKNTNRDKYLQIYYKINSIRINIAHKTTNNGTHRRSAPKDIIANTDTYIKNLTPFFKG